MVDQKLVHIVGIAGSGMCAVAEVSRACEYAVSGSDRHVDRCTPVPVLAVLEAAGCVLYPQDGSGVTAETHAVVISSAIESDNPDLVTARKLAVPIYHRTEWLAHVIGAGPLLGIAGTSGKSTVTAMVGWILQQNGKNPFVVNGAAISAWESSTCSGQVRVGSKDLWVLELDESDRTLLRFKPQHAVITNQSADHFPLAETEALFETFRKNVQVSCLVGPWYPQQYRATLAGGHFMMQGVAFDVPLIGKHNAANALAAAELCQCVGIPIEASAEALRTFPGVRRRLERVEPAGDRFVFDDFGHNPAKIVAAIESILPFVNALTVIWRPHGYGPLRNMMADLVRAFEHLAVSAKSEDRRHRLLLLPVYDVGGTAQRDIQAGDLAAKLKPCGVETYCLAMYAEILEYCEKKYVQTGDAVLVMGARDPGLAGLARDIAQQYVIAP